jgi:hypothetical protein
VQPGRVVDVFGRIAGEDGMVGHDLKAARPTRNPPHKNYETPATAPRKAIQEEGKGFAQKYQDLQQIWNSSPSERGKWWRMYCGDVFAASVDKYMIGRISSLEAQINKARTEHSGWGGPEQWGEELEYFKRAFLVRNNFRILMYLEHGMDLSALPGGTQAKTLIDAAAGEGKAQIEKGKLIHEMPEPFKQIDLEIDEFCTWGWEPDGDGVSWTGPPPYRSRAGRTQRFYNMGSQYDMFFIMIETEMRALFRPDEPWEAEFEYYSEAYLRWKDRYKSDVGRTAPAFQGHLIPGSSGGDTTYARWRDNKSGRGGMNPFREIDVQMADGLLKGTCPGGCRAFERTFYDETGRPKGR